MKFKLLFIALLVSIFCFANNVNEGTITGILTDKSSDKKALPAVVVTIKEANIRTTTDADGKFSITLPPGTYIVEFSLAGYESTEQMVTVNEGQTTMTNESLAPSSSYNLKEVVIKSSGNREKETALLLEQKNAVVIKQSIGAQEMSRKGVSDVEEGLTKITGITKVGNRGLFVRGLEDRYNNLLINDLAAPSNSPFTKIVPLDLFPTNIVGVIDVYKTFNPNIYGDFAGGTFNIQTSKVSKSVTKLNIGFGYTTGNSLQDFLLSQDADNTKGFFGFNGKERELPSFLGETASRKTFTKEQALNSVSGDKGFNVSKTKAPLNSSINLLHSEKFTLNKNRFISYLLSLNYDNNFAMREGVDRTLEVAGHKYYNNFVTTEYRFKTANSALIGLNYNTDRLKLMFSTLYIKTTLNSIKDQYGQLAQNGIDNNIIRTNQLEKSDYLNAQLVGEYNLTEDKNQTLKAGVSLANTKYEQPDRKFYSGTQVAENQINTSYGGNNFLRQYLTIDGNSYFSALAEYNLKFGKDGKQNKLTVGYNGNISNMESSYRFVASRGGMPFSTNNMNEIDTKIKSDLITDPTLYFEENSNSTYKVKLNEMANAGYVNLLLKFADKFEVNGGVRVENTTKETHYRPLGSFDVAYSVKTYDNLYVLPSLNAKYLLNETSNIRFAASKTYTKPVVMESFPLTYINADNTSTQGNALLKNSDNYNVDLKYELFPTSKEMFAVGLFGKHIDTPIERTFIANATSGTVTTFLNSDNANLFGAEIEFLLALERINDNLDHFSFGLNTTVMSTKVTVAPTYQSQDETGAITTKSSIETHQTRALQGASNWLVNSDLKYEFNLNKDWTNTISLVYGVFGKRIFAVGTLGQDNVYELPVQQLDLVWGSKISEHFNVKFTADNLLNPARKLEFGNDGTNKITEDSLLKSSYKKGIGFSLNIGYTF